MISVERLIRSILEPFLTIKAPSYLWKSVTPRDAGTLNDLQVLDQKLDQFGLKMAHT